MPRRFERLLKKGEDQPFTKGRSKEITIRSKKRIGEGKRGNVYRVTADITGEGGRSRRRTFVLKDYGELNNDKATTQFLVQRSLELYSLLRKLNIDTWTTYRSEEDGLAILMTDGEGDEGEYVITANNKSKSREKIEGKVKQFSNFEEAFKNAVQSAVRAGENDIGIDDHAWMGRFRLEKDVATLHVFLGDLDNLIIRDTMAADRRILANLINLRFACTGLLYNTLARPSEAFTTYRATMDRILAEQGFTDVPEDPF